MLRTCKLTSLGFILGLASACPAALMAQERLVGVEGRSAVSKVAGPAHSPDVSSSGAAGPLRVYPGEDGFVDFVCYAENYDRDLDREYYWRVQVKDAGWENVAVVTWDFLDESLSVPAGMDGKSVIARRFPFPLPPGQYHIRAMLIDPTKPAQLPCLVYASQVFTLD